MTARAAVTLASLVHSLLRVSIFLEQPLDGCSPAPSLASWLFFIAMILLIRDIEIYPRRYAFIPSACRIFAEFVIALLLMEFGTIIIWCTMEKLIYKLMKCILMENSSNMYYDMGGDALVGVLITIFSFCILVNVSLATEVYYDLKFRLSQLCKIYCDRKQRALSRISCTQNNICPSELEVDSDGLCCCPPVQTRRKACQNLCTSSRRTAVKSKC